MTGRQLHGFCLPQIAASGCTEIVSCKPASGSNIFQKMVRVLEALLQSGRIQACMHIYQEECSHKRDNFGQYTILRWISELVMMLTTAPVAIAPLRRSCALPRFVPIKSAALLRRTTIRCTAVIKREDFARSVTAAEVLATDVAKPKNSTFSPAIDDAYLKTRTSLLKGVAKAAAVLGVALALVSVTRLAGLSTSLAKRRMTRFVVSVCGSSDAPLCCCMLIYTCMQADQPCMMPLQLTPA
jgi:hypothetical protein